jgi:hypothetical protein
MNRYIIQQEATGWFWRRESDRSWFGWPWSDRFVDRTSGGPFATAEEAEQDARNDQFLRFGHGKNI